MSRLVAISNRTSADTGARAGGLAVAIHDTLASSGGEWVGWSGEIVDTPPRVVTRRQDGIELVLTDLTREEHAGFYLGYANRVLWPVFHYRVDLAAFDGHAFDAYAAVNRRFARLAAERVHDGDIVWAHDYHFLLLGEELRGLGWSGRIGFFLHIPFPAPEIFRALPEHREIAHAMCAYDVVGVQTERDRANFVRYLVEDHGARETEDRRVKVGDLTPLVAAYPIGIDAQAFADLSRSPAAHIAAERISSVLAGRKLVIGVDRMDYSKGLPERFEAVGRLFDAYPASRGAVSVTQIAPPSRTKVEEYQDLRTKLYQLAGRINGDYGDLDWIPLRYLARPYEREELAGLFHIARVGLVTPLHDGMNLVCKEFVMAQTAEDPGVLVLSEFAGAAERLEGALIVNPHDTDAVAQAIDEALHMPLTERRQRWQTSRDIVVREDVNWWRDRFLEDLAQVAE